MEMISTDISDLNPDVWTERPQDGAILTDARIARIGIMEYPGDYLGKPEMETIRVFRSEDEVFDPASMASFGFKTVTKGHPGNGREFVTANNWKKVAVGVTSGEPLRDGEFLRIPMMISDAATIAEIKAGKRELSAGYSSEYIFEKGITADGESYDAKQVNIRGNHVAIVDRGRAGNTRIGDSVIIQETTQPAPEKETEIMADSAPAPQLTTVIIGDSVVHTDPVAAAHITRLTADMKTMKDKSTKDEADMEDMKKKATGDIATKDAEIAELKKQIPTADSITALVHQRVALQAKAKVLAPQINTDGMPDTDAKIAVLRAAENDATLFTDEAHKDATYVNAYWDRATKGVKEATTDSFRQTMTARSAGPGGAEDPVKIVGDAMADQLAYIDSGNRPADTFQTEQKETV